VQITFDPKMSEWGNPSSLEDIRKEVNPEN